MPWSLLLNGSVGVPFGHDGARRASLGQVLVVDVPGVLDIDDPHVAAAPARDGAGEVDVEALLGGLGVGLVVGVVRRHRSRRGERLGVGDLDDVETVERVDDLDRVGLRAETQPVVEIQVGQLAPRPLLQPCLVPLQCRLGAREQPHDLRTREPPQHVVERLLGLRVLGDELASTEPEVGAFDELQVKGLVAVPLLDHGVLRLVRCHPLRESRIRIRPRTCCGNLGSCKRRHGQRRLDQQEREQCSGHRHAADS